MWKQYLQFLCVFGAVCFTNSETPSFITKCKADDAKCIKESTKAAIPFFTAGLPDYNVETLDPLHIKSINASEGNLLFLLNDVTLSGLKNCDPKKVERNVAKSKLYIKVLCSGILDGQYELKGSILVVPIEGNGKIHVDLRSALVSIDVDLIEKKSDDGTKYWQIKSWKHSFELKDKSDVKFDNLYDGNEVLGRAARELVENNGNDIIIAIGSPVIKSLVGEIVKNANNLFKKVSAEDLTID